MPPEHHDLGGAAGTYVCARRELGNYWGFLAGWSFVVGKTASLAAMALTFGSYLSVELARPLGIGAVVALAGVNYLGVEKTARLTRVVVGLVLAALAVTVAAALIGGEPSAGNLTGDIPPGAGGVLQSAYYGLANAAAWRLSDSDRRWPRWLAALGFALCGLLAFTLPPSAVIGGLTLLAVGSLAWFATARHR